MPACPTPQKPRYRDEIAAKLAAASPSVGTRRRGYDERPGLSAREAYRCPAGHWHTRTVSKNRRRDT